MRFQVTVLTLAVLSILLIDCGASSDNETTTVPSKYITRRLFKLKSTTTTTPGTDNTDTTTVVPVITTQATKTVKRKITSTTTSSPVVTTEELKESTTTELPSTTTALPTTTAPKLNCGIRDMDSDVHPWIVVLEHSESINSTRRKTFSKGVLISDQYVLTTVSSIHNSHPFWEVNRVRLGDFPVGLYNKIASYKPVFADVAEIILHPTRDIALIKLDAAVNFTELIQPMCLPTSDNYNFRELILHSCTKSKKKKGGHSRIVTESMSVLPISPQDCSTLFHRKGADFNSREEFCSWDERVDNCTGDLGAPLIGKISQNYHLIGLASYATSTRAIKDESLPGVYTRVGRHLKWIQQVLDRNL